MRRMLIYSLLFLLCPFIASAEFIKLGWDYSADEQIDGFRLFQTHPSKDSEGKWVDVFDYDNPIQELPADARITEVEVPGKAEGVLKYVFVIRAYRGNTESSDSNKASYKVVLINPDKPINLYGQYDQESSIVSLAWEQPPDDYDVHKWIVYYRLEDQTEYKELGSVNKGQDLTMTKTFDVAPLNAKTVVYFSVVAFRKDNTAHSENADEIAITIDRRDSPPPPDNLKVNIEIKVE